MFVLVLNGITKPFNHRDTETLRKTRDARPGLLCLCVFVVKSSGISMAAQPLFPGAVPEKGRVTIPENARGPRRSVLATKRHKKSQKKTSVFLCIFVPFCGQEFGGTQAAFDAAPYDGAGGSRIGSKPLPGDGSRISRAASSLPGRWRTK